MERLNKTVLAQAQIDSLQKPAYNTDDIRPGIVHLGIGAFHRAHQAFYTESILNSGGGHWGIVGCSLRSPTVKNQLAPQDGLYTLVERGPEGEKFQVIGAVRGLMVGPDDPAKLVAVMAGENVKVVSLTVTEKGYCHDPATGDLNQSHPDIQHDIAHPDTPRSAVGYIVAALRQRRADGIKSFTAMSCDNLPDNGHVLKKVTLQFARQVDDDLAKWIEENTAFPCTMIDRIVPATTDADRDELEKTLGYRDEGMVMCEPFTQWVIEDNFSNERPAWEEAGALLVSDVSVYEKMKLRLLNGSHSLLAYTGYLSGFNLMSEVMTEPALVAMCKQFMDREAGETLKTPSGFDIEQYKQDLRDRFANTGLKHRTWQIAMDGSQKLPQRLLDTLRDQLSSKGHIDILCLAVAAWIRYVSGEDEKGQPIDVQDPWAEKLRAIHEDHKGNPEVIVQKVLGIKEIFGDDLATHPLVVAGVTGWLQRFYADGVLTTLKASFG